jgi:hypothetical protein
MTDLGKLEFLFEPYSPYRQWDDLRLSNGYPDMAYGACIHIIRCDGCDYETEFAVGERLLPHVCAALNPSGGSRL